MQRLENDEIFKKMVKEYIQMLETTAERFDEGIPEMEACLETFLLYVTSINEYGNQLLKRSEFVKEHKFELNTIMPK